jgi:NAD(P)-dependent dehydrogenase (short-subunit alcohol dehydrogenase family)
MSKNIEGKVPVIAGASSGLGEATARHLRGRAQAVGWVHGAKIIDGRAGRMGLQGTPCGHRPLRAARKSWSDVNEIPLKPKRQAL